MRSGSGTTGRSGECSSPAPLIRHGLRLITSGVFDHYPKLKIVLGHMGEAIPYWLYRMDYMHGRSIVGMDRPKLKRRPSEHFKENFYITTSGYFTVPPFLCTLQVVGADRILFSVDYPYSPNTTGRNFLNALPISPEDLGKISHGNAERLLKV